jgi:hypothetical protein
VRAFFSENQAIHYYLLLLVGKHKWIVSAGKTLLNSIVSIQYICTFCYLLALFSRNNFTIPFCDSYSSLTCKKKIFSWTVNSVNYKNNKINYPSHCVWKIPSIF